MAAVSGESSKKADLLIIWMIGDRPLVQLLCQLEKANI